MEVCFEHIWTYWLLRKVGRKHIIETCFIFITWKKPFMSAWVKEVHGVDFAWWQGNRKLPMLSCHDWLLYLKFCRSLHAKEQAQMVMNLSYFLKIRLFIAMIEEVLTTPFNCSAFPTQVFSQSTDKETIQFLPTWVISTGKEIWLIFQFKEKNELNSGDLVFSSILSRSQI